MKKCPICDSNYGDNCICAVCGYDESKDYENYKTLTKIPQVIAAQYKGNKTACAVIKEISERDNQDIKLREDASSTKKKKPLIKKELLLGIGIGILAMLISPISNMDKPRYSLRSDMTGYVPPLEEGTSTVFGSEYQREDIKEIQFLNSTENAPAGEYWDVSEDGSFNVIAWVDAQGILYIAADGIILAPEYCTNLFAGYENVLTIEFNDCFDTSQVTDMSRMFFLCDSLGSVDVSGFDTSQVTDMSYMFFWCNSLESVDVSGFDTSQVTNMNCMFDGCDLLTSVDVSGFDTSQVTDMSYMFNGCYSLTRVDVSGFDTSQVTNMNCMFDGCDLLTSVDVSGFDISKVESMEDMFDANTTPIVGDSGIQP